MQKATILRPSFENIEFQKEGSNLILNFGPQHPSAHLATDFIVPMVLM